MLAVAVYGILPFAVSQVSAATCTQYGNSAYCTDGANTTTYTQYGNNIYGSDGSVYTMYGNTTYGSNNVINTSGNSGNNLPTLSTAGADMDSPEMKAAWAKYQETCITNKSESGIGGTQFNNCRDAVSGWLQALNNSVKTNASSPPTQPVNYNTGNPASQNESADEYTARLQSFIEDRYGNTQPKDLCVSRGILNSHQEGNSCICNDGFFQSNNKCINSVEICKDLGVGGISVGADLCGCDTGYTLSGKKCVKDILPFTNFTVSGDEIIQHRADGRLTDEANFRKCPSTNCEIIGYYPKNSIVPIIGEYKNNSWYEVQGTNPEDTKTIINGWIHKSLVEILLKNNVNDNQDDNLVLATDSPANLLPKTDNHPKETWFKKVWKILWKF